MIVKLAGQPYFCCIAMSILGLTIYLAIDRVISLSISKTILIETNIAVIFFALFL